MKHWLLMLNNVQFVLKELDDKIGFIKSETDSIIADVRSDSNEIRLVAENAKKLRIKKFWTVKTSS